MKFGPIYGGIAMHFQTSTPQRLTNGAVGRLILRNINFKNVKCLSSLGLGPLG